MKGATKLLILSVMIGLLACSEQPREIKLVGNKWLGYQPLYIGHVLAAADRRAEAENTRASDIAALSEDYDITMLSSTTSAMRILANGEVDGAFLTLDEAIKFSADTGIELCIPLVIDYSFGGDALVFAMGADRRVGRKLRVGHESSALGAYMLRRAIDFLGWSMDEIEPVLVEPIDHVMTFQRGDIDAVITFEPYLSELIDLGGEVRFSSRDIPQEIIDVLVVRRQVWGRHRARFVSLAEVVWPYGLDAVVKGSPVILAMLESNTGLNQRTLSNALQGIRFVSVDENKRILGDELNESINKMNSYLIDAQVVDKRVTLSSCE